MTTRFAIAIALALAACGAIDHGGPSLVPGADAPADVRAGCELAAHRCSRCHTLDRVVDAPAVEPEYWRVYVRRMRLTPGSGIRPDEEPPILRCLLYRSFGPTALGDAAVAP